jgi:CotS family spore coat protein
LDAKDVKAIVEKEYGVNVSNIEALKNIYRVNISNKEFCLKVIKYEFGHFFFILNAIKHLQRNGFYKIPEIIRTQGGIDYIELGSSYAYLTPWINARHCNYNNPLDINKAVLKLAELHIKSRGFNVTKEMKPRIGWLKWIETYKTRKDEIFDFKYRINKKEKLSKFDEIYLEIMNDELRRADSAIKNLINSNYIEKMKKEIKSRGFCHHDYAYHNVLIDKDNEVNIIDFDYCILDTHLHDLSSLLIRRMKYGKWDLKNAVEVLDIYNSASRIYEDDIPIMAAFMEFPQDYWQRGIQYYWEQKPWGEEFFIKKLQKYIEDREQKQELIEQVRKIKLEG